MPAFTLSTDGTVSQTELLSLYASVGWSAYTNHPLLLDQAIRSSSFVVVARDEEGALLGLARAISDDATIAYVQDILVNPSFQGAGVGRALFGQIQERYRHVRQTVLITDDEPRQRAFYESLGLTEGSDFRPEPVRVFAQFRRPL
ncbi:GNAT family N-acetyltransferase [Paenarthrobacter nitroguajacolicus]|uniref:GNAT family N-acetyltransferase n=1 Tax=Paenarthrobacter nitroguajacolicus TaxID=211146 RepID=UPI0015BB377C|nr:GNAT family N-acetyltransferase [Paenarthrobacter nitroguajacolicus]NWL35490.1 GNAT family N-acetyltransferase [Paenarthrobacter nitroguajacolicus]